MISVYTAKKGFGTLIKRSSLGHGIWIDIRRAEEQNHVAVSISNHLRRCNAWYNHLGSRLPKG